MLIFYGGENKNKTKVREKRTKKLGTKPNSKIVMLIIERKVIMKMKKIINCDENEDQCSQKENGNLMIIMAQVLAGPRH